MSPHATMLVLSAEPQNAARTARELQGLGYEVPIPVAPFAQGTELARLHHPRLVVLDLCAGSILAGLHAAEQIRGMTDLPILLLVSDVEPDEQAFIAGAHSFEYLMRPFVASALRTAVELALARHASRKMLRTDDDRYRDLVENSYDLICTHDVNGVLLSVNAAAIKALGYPSEGLIGRHLQDFLVEETRHLFPAYLAEILEKGSSHGVMRMQALNGEVREWEYHNSERRLEDGRRIIRGLAHDVTEQLKAARELRASEQRFRALFEQAAVGVAYIDTQSGKPLTVNQRCAQIVGHAHDELLTRTFVDLIHPADQSQYSEPMARLARGDVSEFVAELRLLGKEGADVWVALSVSSVSRVGSRSPKHMVVIQDISQRKLAERQRTVLEAQLRQAQKMEAIGTLAGGIAHDFNNLLTTMMGNVELAKLDVEPDHPAVASLDAIAAAARRATDLVRQILAFSRKQPSQRSVIALPSVIEDSARLLRASLPAAIQIELRLEEAPLVLADATQVHQVVMNLCTNAWQAITANHGRIEIILDAVDMDVPSTTNADGGTVARRFARIRVRDTGEGMSASTLERIFEPFFTTKAAGRGSGLGLSVAHGIVKDHGGTITAHSREGEGATFEVLLPAAVAGAVTVTSEPEHTIPLFGQGHVLYVDDEKALGVAVARMLESLGYRATVCNSAADAIELVRETPQAFDIVLTDFSMPGLSGTDLARELMRIRPGLPVVLTSGYAERAGENLSALGICLRLDKPFDRVTLSEALSQVLASSIKAVG